MLLLVLLLLSNPKSHHSDWYQGAFPLCVPLGVCVVSGLRRKSFTRSGFICVHTVGHCPGVIGMQLPPPAHGRDRLSPAVYSWRLGHGRMTAWTWADCGAPGSAASMCVCVTAGTSPLRYCNLGTPIEIRSLMPPALFFFLNCALAVWGLLR